MKFNSLKNSGDVRSCSTLSGFIKLIAGGVAGGGLAKKLGKRLHFVFCLNFLQHSDVRKLNARPIKHECKLGF